MVWHQTNKCHIYKIIIRESTKRDNHPTNRHLNRFFIKLSYKRRMRYTLKKINNKNSLFSKAERVKETTLFFSL